ncbi:bifunctional phosphoribosyl-AMP cyclohydrolase/phosphoribosyl-ATP diphosphatase HisIE [Fulvivirga sp. RKSG066]|uniref:bifunctional phosphoribosyl-AMP cyclohydrolase/phosphoribosyl-ATP diphosphatase HisIE n=1 Tax=Fulvivirga aurantia TaxID=2529383 RepID=UPI0012BC0549|nr:bifunctional phosphoribosyl-AMP cyclohydrolase/phosphoribosyl-ATP diphosphatase HisIE [Fulvivirga aurantia]MTI20297.1 bifunctional phosphoribosyl-AMP cyclohydrolase/phosphoribosyl-ATP diphosphatase HisIE [Fulvivirga aurantia]
MIELQTTPDFNKLNGLIPAIIQDYYTNKVLMLAFMNNEALEKTKAEGKVTFYSRSKERLWTKGETSGNFLNVESMELDCDNDTLLIMAIPEGPACHKGNDTCFGEKKNTSTDLGFLEATIQNRVQNPKKGSYTNSLLDSGINKVAQKVGEEAVELVIEAKDDDEALFLNEASDLMYHYLVLLAAKGYSLNDVIDVLKERHG